MSERQKILQGKSGQETEMRGRPMPQVIRTVGAAACASVLVLMVAVSTPSNNGANPSLNQGVTVSAKGSGWWGGGSGGCSGCTIYNHNQTLVEDAR